MSYNALNTVSRDAIKRHILTSLVRYWPIKEALIADLPIKSSPFPLKAGSLRLVEIVLPDWAASCGINKILLVPSEALTDPEKTTWDSVDWWLAAFLLLECWHERIWEKTHGIIHSYSNHLKKWDTRVWERAWVNRIALFMRSWAAFLAKQEENTLFEPLPRAEIQITHDVDAVAKTLAIRLKQSAFLGFNFLRLLLLGKIRAASQYLGQSFRFLFSQNDWWMFEVMQEMESQKGFRSQFNFYADNRSKTLSRWLFDPGYDIGETKISDLLACLAQGGWRIGLHPTYDAWQSADLIRAQRERLQFYAPIKITSCRQHWLRFSWEKTWAAQSEAGILEDTTLMFNDRPGFRNAAALSWKPWDANVGGVHKVSALPTILMDSHFYDYQPMSSIQRRAAFCYWLDEVFSVSGEAAVLWHPHTINADYNWRKGYDDLLSYMEGKGICSNL